MKRVKQVKSIPQKIWREAEKIATGLYRANARSAFAYAFNFNDKEICYGEFMFNANRDELRLKDFDGYLTLDKLSA